MGGGCDEGRPRAQRPVAFRPESVASVLISLMTPPDILNAVSAYNCARDTSPDLPPPPNRDVP